ncbi:MAG: extracellular solute-binding protein [Bacteroidetes bacterium]|nr:extracellular solute-binding protein [Rhodothermia bacterium]MCS7155738.1 extracellular solute-binding protein [Bacteroidota bacterium]MCX7906161.1 extracellular solute-binding protein [Bacteroidota bacterium]MDW8138289.1 extracellular solute-binding protein [Bacteroidota bacterium]MDW8285973.1 extracellular solute-binding protein [Bacteroidota bacterium]
MSRYNWMFGLLLLVACQRGPERVVLLIYSPHGKEQLAHYEAAFERLYPQVDVQWLDMSSQAIYDRIATERANPQASLWWGGPSWLFEQAAEEGLLEPYRPTWADMLDPAHRDTHFRWVGLYWTPEVIVYNHRRLSSEEAPQDWDELLEPRWRDRILLRYPPVSGTMQAIFGALILRQPTVEEGFRWLARLDEQTRTYAADPTQLYVLLARGEAPITLWNLTDAVLQAERYGFPFAVVVPKSGAPMLLDGIALVRGGPNLSWARRFYEFVTSREALLEQSRLFYRLPTRRDIAPEELPRWVPADLRPMPVDWSRLRRMRQRWMQYWDEHIRGRGAQYLHNLIPPPPP